MSTGWWIGLAFIAGFIAGKAFEWLRWDLWLEAHFSHRSPTGLK